MDTITRALDQLIAIEDAMAFHEDTEYYTAQADELRKLIDENDTEGIEDFLYWFNQ